MSDPKETTCECTLIFSSKGDNSPSFDATIHFIEDTLDECEFWYGVAQVQCQRNEVTELMERAINEGMIRIQLDDGRKSYAICGKGGMSGAGPEAIRMRLALVGRAPMGSVP